ncbi:MAG: transcription antitermination factor NusB [Pseudomonadota bacterium]
MKHQAATRARRRALQALYQWTLNPSPAAEICQQFGEEQDMSQVDGDLFQALVAGAVAEHQALDEVLGEHSERALDQLDAMELSILRLAGFELKNRVEVPYRVVLNEAVELAQRFGSDQTPGFVNGVLDRCARHWRPHETRGV